MDKFSQILPSSYSFLTASTEFDSLDPSIVVRSTVTLWNSTSGEETQTLVDASSEAVNWIAVPPLIPTFTTTTTFASRADLRDGIQEIIRQNFWANSWELIKTLPNTADNPDINIPPADRQVVVRDVFLRSPDPNNVTLVARVSIGAFRSEEKAGSFGIGFDALSLAEKARCFVSSNSSAPISFGVENISSFPSGFSLGASLLRGLRFLGTRLLKRLPDRECPPGERPSVLRELSNLTTRLEVFGVPTRAGCEDVEECNLGVDTSSPLGLGFSRVYPIPERSYDLVRKTNTTSNMIWGASNICDRRSTGMEPAASIGGLPADFGHFRSSHQPHICRESLGGYTCECADGYILEPQPHEVWSFVLGADVRGNSSCVEMSCFQHKCLADVGGFGWPGLYWTRELGATLPERIRLLKECFLSNRTANGTNVDRTACCTAGAFEVLQCLSDRGVCHDSSHPEDVKMRNELSTAIETLCEVDAVEFEERGNLDFKLDLHVTVLGTNSSVSCDELDTVSLPQSPFFLRELRRDVFAQLVGTAGGTSLFGSGQTILRELIHFTNFHMASQTCANGSNVTTSAQRYDVVVELRHWPLVALMNLTESFFPRYQSGDCVVALHLSSQRVPFPGSSGMQMHEGVVRIGPDAGSSPVRTHRTGSAYSMGLTPASRLLSEQASSENCQPLGEIAPGGRRLRFISHLEKCMLEEVDDCRKSPELAVARFYEASYGNDEYEWYPGGDGGLSFSSRGIFNESRARYFSHDIFASGLGGRIGYDLFELEDVRSSTRLVEAISFPALTNPAGEFENHFVSFRGSNCMDLPGTEFSSLSYGPAELPADPAFRERFCTSACFLSEECRSVTFGTTYCSLHGGTTLDFAGFQHLVDDSAELTCFVKDVSHVRLAAFQDGVEQVSLLSSGILEVCLFEQLANCCPFLQVFFGGCVEKCGERMMRSNRTQLGYNVTTGFPIQVSSHAQGTASILRPLSSYRAEVFELCATQSADEVETKFHIEFELEFPGTNLHVTHYFRGPQGSILAGGSVPASRADLREGLEISLTSVFWTHSWLLMRTSDSVIPPVDRQLVVTDVFLRAAHAANASMVSRFSIGSFRELSTATAFAEAFGSLSLGGKIALLGDASLPIRFPDSGNATGFDLDPPSLLGFRFLGIQNVTRLADRGCPVGQRPSFVREETDLVVSKSLFGDPTDVVGCEDIDECNTGIDIQSPPPMFFDELYSVAERAQDMVEVLNRSNLFRWEAANICERRTIASLPADFGHFRSPMQPHHCLRGPPGDYVCECADGYRISDHPNQVWSLADQVEITRNSSCVEMSCFQHKCLADVAGFGWPGLYWTRELGATLPERIRFFDECFLNETGTNPNRTTSACCTAGAFEILHCLSDRGVCHDSSHPEDVKMRNELSTAIEQLCGVDAAEFEERGDLQLEVELVVDLLGTSSVACEDLEHVVLHDSPLFLRHLRTDIFVQLFPLVGDLFGQKVTALRELLHFPRLRRTLHVCITNAENNTTVEQRYDFVVELRQWPLPALLHLAEAFFPRLFESNNCVVRALQLTSQRVPYPLMQQIPLSNVTYIGTLQVSSNKGSNPAHRHQSGSLFEMGASPSRLLTDMESCQPLGASIPSGRRLRFDSHLEKCMRAHPDQCRQHPELSIARFYRAFYESGEYAWFPGGDQGVNFSSSVQLDARRPGARYFSHDIYAGGMGGGLGYDLWELDDVRSIVENVGGIGSEFVSEAISFSVLTNPAAVFEEQFVVLRNLSCVDLPGAVSLSEDFGFVELRFGYAFHERLCKQKCFRSWACRAVEVGSMSCTFYGGVSLGYGGAHHHATVLVESTCFLKDASQARDSEYDGSLLFASGILEDCLFGAGGRADCCPFLQTFLGGCGERCGEKILRSNSSVFGYNLTTGFPLVGDGGVVPDHSVSSRSLSSYRADVGELCLARSDLSETRSHVQFQIEFPAPDLRASHYYRGSEGINITNGDVASRADLREGLQDVLTEVFWANSWSLMRNAGVLDIPPVDRTLIVSDVFLWSHGTGLISILQIFTDFSK